jgi:hypothetical protein
VDVVDLIVRGGFPEIRTLDDQDRIDRYMSYLDSIVERDVAPVAEVRKPDTLRRLIDQLAVRTAEELCVGAWTSSGGKREVRAPKLHFLDTGCATALRAEDSSSFGLNADPVALGHLLESLVFIELEKSLPLLSKRWRLYHWRQQTREIDIVAEAPGRLLALFEIKAATTAGVDDFRHINWFLSEGPDPSYFARRLA